MMDAYTTFKDDVQMIVDNCVPRFTNIVATSFGASKGPYVAIRSITIDTFNTSCEFVDLQLLVGFDETSKCYGFTLSVPTEEITNIEFVCGVFYARLIEVAQKEDEAQNE